MTTRWPDSGFNIRRETALTATFQGRMGSSCPMITTERGAASAAKLAEAANPTPNRTKIPAKAGMIFKRGVVASARPVRGAAGVRGHFPLGCQSIAGTTDSAPCL
jgi:hypothetical protein